MKKKLKHKTFTIHHKGLLSVMWEIQTSVGHYTQRVLWFTEREKKALLNFLILDDQFKIDDAMEELRGVFNIEKEINTFQFAVTVKRIMLRYEAETGLGYCCGAMYDLLASKLNNEQILKAMGFLKDWGFILKDKYLYAPAKLLKGYKLTSEGVKNAKSKT